MIAMGAAAAAFTAARFVVLAEGATEMILLPSLIRKATGLEILPYQVAPGLSEVPKDFYQSLDLEGAKVAYVLDGDAGGKALRKALQKRGVPEERIVMIPAPGLENVLVADVYLSAVASLLREQYQEVQVPELPVLTVADESSWATQLSVWASRHRLQMPSKVAIANRLALLGGAETAHDDDGGNRLQHARRQAFDHPHAQHQFEQRAQPSANAATHQ